MPIPEEVVPPEHWWLVEKAETLKDRLMSFDKRTMLENYKKLLNFAFALVEKYTREKAAEYILFHVLIGSTPGDGLVKIDFEGDDSIIRFLEHHSREQTRSRPPPPPP